MREKKKVNKRSALDYVADSGSESNRPKRRNKRRERREEEKGLEVTKRRGGKTFEGKGEKREEGVFA